MPNFHYIHQDSFRLQSDVIDLIVQSVNLHHLKREDIGPETTLMQGGLGLDSVDILEVVVAVEHKYNVRVPDSEAGAKHFRSIGSICQFVGTYEPK